VALSEDHKPSQEEEQKRVIAAGGFVEDDRVNGSLNMSRSLGDFEYKSNESKNYKEQMVTCLPDIRKVDRAQQDKFIVLACDGIWDCLNNQETVDLLKNYMSNRESTNVPQATAFCVEKMFDKICAPDILQSGGVGTDNMTAIIVEFL
jgi:serine/threonine protein phosphatase PrpC